MIPPHNIYQIYHSLSVRDDCNQAKCGELSEYTDSGHTGGSFFRMYEWVECVWTMRARHKTTSSQDWLDRMKLVPDRTWIYWMIKYLKGYIGWLNIYKDILDDEIFKINVGYTNLGTRQIQGRLSSRICLFITHDANMAGYPTKNNVFIGNI